MKSCALAARAAASICASRVLPGRAVRDVVAHRIVEQHRVLTHDPDERAKRRQRDLARVHAVEQDAARGRLVEARNEIDERALPRSARRRRARSTSPFGAPRARRRVSTGSSSYANDTRSNSSARSNAAGAIVPRSRLRLGRAVEHLEHPLGRRERLLRRRRHLRQLLERLQHAHDEDEERDERRAGQRCRPSAPAARRPRESAPRSRCRWSR